MSVLAAAPCIHCTGGRETVKGDATGRAGTARVSRLLKENNLFAGLLISFVNECTLMKPRVARDPTMPLC